MPVKNMCITLSPKAQRELSERSRKLNLSKSAYLELLVYLDLEKYDKRELMLLRAEAIDRRSTDRGEDHFVPMESEEAAHAISAEMLMENEDTLPKFPPKKGLTEDIVNEIVKKTVERKGDTRDEISFAIDEAAEGQMKQEPVEETQLQEEPQPEPAEEEKPDVEEPQTEEEQAEEEPKYDFLKPKKKRINTM